VEIRQLFLHFCVMRQSEDRLASHQRTSTGLWDVGDRLNVLLRAQLDRAVRRSGLFVVVMSFLSNDFGEAGRGLDVGCVGVIIVPGV
jgi:hypothetical protein